MNWFYAKNGAQQGPLSTDELKSRIAMGEVGQDDLAWSEGMSDWTPVGQIPELKIQAPVREETPAPPVAATTSYAPSPYQSPTSPAAAPVAVAPGQAPAQGLAIGSMVCGILAFLGCCAWYLAGPLAVVAVVLGHIAISRNRANPAANGGKSMAKTGLILGYIALLAAIVIAALSIWFMTLTPQQMEGFLQQLPEEQRREIIEKFEEAKQQQR